VHTFFKYDEDTPLHCKGAVSCFSGKHFEIETTKDTRSTKRIVKSEDLTGAIRFFVSFVLFVVSNSWLRPEAALCKARGR